jgi:hypothetical protein
MQLKPVLFWPKARSDIKLHLDREETDFLVVETNFSYELQKLYKIRRDTPIFDPFPHHGEHYRDFAAHVIANDCRCHIVGLGLCKEVLQTLEDPSLAGSPIDEILAAIKPAGDAPHTGKAIDWSSLNWANTGLLAILVFVAAFLGNALFVESRLIAAAIATALFAAFYVCVRGSFWKRFSSRSRRSNDARKSRTMAPPRLLDRLLARLP